MINPLQTILVLVIFSEFLSHTIEWGSRFPVHCDTITKRRGKKKASAALASLNGTFREGSLAREKNRQGSSGLSGSILCTTGYLPNRRRPARQGSLIGHDHLLRYTIHAGELTLWGRIRLRVSILSSCYARSCMRAHAGGRYNCSSRLSEMRNHLYRFYVLLIFAFLCKRTD